MAKKPRIKLNLVKRVKRKHQYVMYLIKKVSDRMEGMGLRLMKYHVILHLCEDIINYGIPLEVDTGSNESGHKATKKAAKLTQKNEATFNKQTAEWLKEVMMLKLALEEMKGHPFWKYLEGHEHDDTQSDDDDDEEGETRTGGAKFECWDDEEQGLDFDTKTKFKGWQKVKLEEVLIDFVARLEQIVINHGMDILQLRTEHTRNGIKFRGHMCFMGKVC